MQKVTIITLLVHFITSVTNAQYRHSIDELQDSVYLAKVEVNGSPAIIDLNGNYVVQPGLYEAIYFDRFAEGLCPVKKNGKEGFIDIYGNEVIPCNWRWIWKFERGLASVGVDYGDGYNILRGYIDRNGKVIVEPKYAWVELVKGADLIRTEELACLYDFNGNLKADNIWSVRQICRNGRLLIDKNGNYGGEYFVDDRGNKLPKNFFKANEYSGGYAYVELRDEIKGAIKGYMDTEGNIKTLEGYEWLEDFKDDGFALVARDSQHKGLVNTKFDEIIPCVYEDISSLTPRENNKMFANGLVQVKRNDEYALINQKNEIIIPFGKYFRYKMKINGLLEAYTYNKYNIRNKEGNVTSSGYTKILIDTEGNPVSDFEYEYIGTFNNGFASVNRDRNYGIIDTKGQEVIPTKYKFDDIVGDVVIKEFTDLGVVRVSKDGKWGLLNSAGEMIVPYIYDKIEWYRDGVAVVKQNKKYGAIDTSGNLVVPVQFFIQDIIGRFNGNRLGIRKRTSNGIKAGYIDKDGNEIIPCIYDKVYPYMKISVN